MRKSKKGFVKGDTITLKGHEQLHEFADIGCLIGSIMGSLCKDHFVEMLDIKDIEKMDKKDQYKMVSSIIEDFKETYKKGQELEKEANRLKKEVNDLKEQIEKRGIAIKALAATV